MRTVGIFFFYSVEVWLGCWALASPAKSQQVYKNLKKELINGSCWAFRCKKNKRAIGLKKRKKEKKRERELGQSPTALSLASSSNLYPSRARLTSYGFRFGSAQANKLSQAKLDFELDLLKHELSRDSARLPSLAGSQEACV